MDINKIPEHIAIIMDGNGRWAKKRRLPRIAGHKAGVDVVQRVVRLCLERKIRVLTIFTFSSENWKRPADEVTYLMNLFQTVISREGKKLHKKNIKLSIMGDYSCFDLKLIQKIVQIEKLTKNNTALHLVVAFNYGGRWDIAQSVSKILTNFSSDEFKNWKIEHIIDKIGQNLSISNLPEPDLLIRTSGEQRISNFFLWQLAYTELYFTNVFWPDFDYEQFNKAIEFYATRDRRYGKLKDDVKQ